MRVRRIAAAAAVTAAVAATVFATTAAVFPSAQAGRMRPLPALTTSALTARYAASSAAIATAARSAQRSGDPALARALDAMRGKHFLGFDSRGQGEAIEVVGNLATATRVAIMVPGSDTSLTTFDSRGTASPGGGAAALAAQARRLDPGAHLAVIAWLGYATPSTISPAISTWCSVAPRLRPSSFNRPVSSPSSRKASRAPRADRTAARGWSVGSSSASRPASRSFQ